uniref:Uncharacterized protein n=1 Tax=Steinernema glaseri TaxID=37863 RepID=A0A1I8AG10_9BILA
MREINISKKYLNLTRKAEATRSTLACTIRCTFMAAQGPEARLRIPRSHWWTAYRGADRSSPGKQSDLHSAALLGAGRDHPPLLPPVSFRIHPSVLETNSFANYGAPRPQLSAKSDTSVPGRPPMSLWDTQIIGGSGTLRELGSEDQDLKGKYRYSLFCLCRGCGRLERPRTFGQLFWTIHRTQAEMFNMTTVKSFDLF